MLIAKLVILDYYQTDKRLPEHVRRHTCTDKKPKKDRRDTRRRDRRDTPRQDRRKHPKARQEGTPEGKATDQKDYQYVDGAIHVLIDKTCTTPYTH